MTRAPRPLALGIDAGGSAARWQLRGPAGSLAEGHGPPWSGLAFTERRTSERPEAVARLSALITDVLGALSEVEEADGVSAVVAGVTGVTAGEGSAERVRQQLAAALGLAPERVRVVEDVRLAYRAAFAPGEGVLVYAGTGSIALHERRDGTLRRAGGHGHLVDDAGGAHWIGRQALRSVLRAADRAGGPTSSALADALYEALGTRDWPGIRDRVYEDPRGGLASLAPAVAEAANQGDAEAERILHRAGHELAALAGTLRSGLGARLPVALTGGVTRAGPPLLETFRAAVPDQGLVRVVETRPVAAAAAWAWQDAVPPT